MTGRRTLPVFFITMIVMVLTLLVGLSSVPVVLAEDVEVSEQEQVIEPEPVVEPEPVAEQVGMIEQEPIPVPGEDARQEQPIEQEQPPVQEQPIEQEQPPVQEQPIEQEQPPEQEQPIEQEQPLEQEQEADASLQAGNIFDVYLDVVRPIEGTSSTTKPDIVISPTADYDVDYVPTHWAKGAYASYAQLTETLHNCQAYFVKVVLTPDAGFAFNIASKDKIYTNEANGVYVEKYYLDGSDLVVILYCNFFHLTVYHGNFAATCTNPGTKAYYECALCGNWFWDEDCVYPIPEKGEILVSPLGHDWDNWVVTKPATTTQKGSKTRTCKRDPSHKETQEIPMLSGAWLFEDCPPTAWYMTEGGEVNGWVGYAVDNNLMTGYRDDDGVYRRFGPDHPITRGQVVTILFRLGNPGSKATTDPSQYGEVTHFSDVAPGLYYTAAVEWCRYHGIVTGYGDTGLFKPDQPVTREELATMVYRYASHAKGPGFMSASKTKFNSLKETGLVSSWALDAMVWCTDKGIIGGVLKDGVGYLQPGATATRAQAAKIFTVLVRDVL